MFPLNERRNELIEILHKGTPIFSANNERKLYWKERIDDRIMLDEDGVDVNEEGYMVILFKPSEKFESLYNGKDFDVAYIYLIRGY